MVDEKQYYHATWKTRTFSKHIRHLFCMSQRCSYDTVVALLECRLNDSTDFDVNFMVCPAPIGLACQCIAETMRPEGFYHTRMEGGTRVRVTYTREND